MYSEAEILHFYLPKEIGKTATIVSLKNAKVAESIIKPQVAHVTKGTVSSCTIYCNMPPHTPKVNLLQNILETLHKHQSY